MDVCFHTDMQKDTWIYAVSSVNLNPDGHNVPVQVAVNSVVVNGETWPGYLDIGLIDTMKDLLVNFIGAAVFSFVGYFYVKNRGKGWFARNFIPQVLPDGESDGETDRPEE